MIKDIKFSGYSAQPSDYESKDGDLAVSINLVPEDGALKPVQSPANVMKLDDSEVVKFIHKTSAFEHYVLYSETSHKISYIDKSDTEKRKIEIDTLSSVSHFNAVGNTLLAFTDDGFYYYLWKDNSYLYLGNHIPELPISFGLQGEMIRDEEFQITFDNIKFFSGDIWNEFSDTNKTKITSQVLGKVNKFIADNSTNAGKFMFPFFVRYAYRLYDGSLTMHSAPILMVCSSDLAPQCCCTNLHGYKTSTSINSAKIIIAAMFHQLDYAVKANAFQELKSWNDIVKSVDIFISKPIYTYDQNGECTKFLNTGYSDSYSICKHINQKASETKFPIRYQYAKFSWLYAKTFDPDNLTSPSWRLMLPQRDSDAIKADITDNALFYLLKSINIDDLQTTRTILSISKEYLPSLVTREVMTDDYNSHDLLISKYSFGYNSRLNLAGLSLNLFKGYNAFASFPYTDGYVANFSDADPTILDNKVSASVFYFIKQDGRDIIVNGGAAAFGFNTPFLWLFYPNTNAYKAALVVSQYVIAKVYEVNLEPHPTLNGAYYFGDWDGINVESKESTSNIPSSSSDKDRTVAIPNKIYTSEVNNPFYFPVLGINTVGTGEIKGICSAAKALSQGQFGQFPLYAFTTEGVWALEVSNTGSYTARQPITRDVCINSEGITQIDSSVLFPTDRGIMLISGSQTQCITDTIKTEFPFDLLSLPHMKELHNRLNHDTENDKCWPMLPFTEFLKTCRMIYDYVHQRIIVYNSAVTYAYVYSLKSQLWGMIYSNIADNVNSYPNALAIDTTGNLVDFSLAGDDDVHSMLVTRPLKLETPDVFKTMDTVIQRGHFQKGHVQSVLYGSRDLYNWHLVWSSKDHYLRGFRGTPYKYFRIALLCNLYPDESVFGASLQFTPRLTDQPR